MAPFCQNITKYYKKKILLTEAATAFYGDSMITRSIEDIVTMWLNNGNTRMKQ